MNRYKTITTVAVLAAASILLSYIELPIIPPPFSFLRLDFAELPVLLGLMILGPVPTIVLCALRFLITIASTSTPIVGPLANITLELIFIGAWCLMAYRVKKPIPRMVWVNAITVVGAVVCNFLLFIPLYQMMGMFPEGVPALYYIVAGILPLNLIKWPLMTALAHWVAKPLRRVIR